MMATHFVLVGLLCLCGLALSQECRREHLENVNFPGTDITFLYSPDAQHCQYLCTQHSSCLFFTFIRADWTTDNRHFYCYLKSTPSGKPNVQTVLMGATSGFSLKPCNPDPQPCLSEVYPNINFPTADYKSFFTSDYMECQRACTHDPACQFFTFNEGVVTNEQIRYKCYLKFSWSLPRIPVVIHIRARVSGFSHRMRITENCDTACEGKIFQSTNVPGHDIEVLPAASAEHCQTFCSAHPLCTYFSYVSHNFKCYLKNNPNIMARKAEAGVTSGLPARFCQLDNNWIKKTHEEVDFPHSDIRYFVTDHVEACQRTCSEDPNCQFYSYITNDEGDPVYRRRCYLKRVITMPAPPHVTKEANVVSGFSLRNCYYKGIV